MDLVPMVEDAAAIDDLALINKLLLTEASFVEAIDKASEKGNWECVKVLLKCLRRRRGTVDCNDVTGASTVVYNIKPFCPLGMNGRLTVALKLAAIANEHAVVGALLRAGAGERVGYALHAAIKNDSYESAELIIRDAAGASSVNEVDFSGKTPLEVCAVLGKPRMAFLLLEVGKANINYRCEPLGLTALHRAITGGWWGVISVLLSRPDVNINMTCGLLGDTALHVAASSSGVCTRALLKRGANPNARSRGGSTPLHEAVSTSSGSSLLAAQELVRAGADTNATCSSGRSPLHQAAGVANPGAVELLLWPGGADERTRGRDGKTAAQLVGKLVRASKVNQEDVEKVKELLRKAPEERMWRRKLPLFLCRWWVRGSETRLEGYQRQPKRRRVVTAPIDGGAGIDSPAIGTTIWVFKTTSLDIFRTIMTYL